MMRPLATALFAIAFTFSMHADPVQAQVSRTFVSTAGSDSNNCANVASPCRHFSSAVAVTAPGGEVVALDPGNYGSITITHQISIDGQGWAYVAPQSGGNAITINAGSSDIVTIHGLVMDGVGVTGGTNGVVFNSGAALTVIDCFAQNFVFDGSHPTTGNGILIQPASGTISFNINDSVVANNGQAGIFYRPQGTPSANGVIHNVTATNNQYGINVNMTSSSAGAAVIAVSDSALNNNKVDGLYASNGAGQFLTVSIDHVSVVGNGSIGIDAETTTAAILGRSVITGNGTGVQNNTPNTFFTYQDNRIAGNTTTDISSALNPSLLLQ